MENGNNNNYLTMQDDPLFKDPTLMYASTFAEAGDYESLFANLHPSQYCYLPPEPEVIPEITPVPPPSFTDLPTSPNPAIESSISPPLVRNNNHQTFLVNCQNSSSQAPPSTPPPPPPPPLVIVESSIGGRFGNSSEIQHQQLEEVRQRHEDQLRRLLQIGSRRQDGRYYCSECNKMFLTSQALGGHRSSHARAKKKDREWAESLANGREAAGPNVESSSRRLRDRSEGRRREGQGYREDNAIED